MGVNQCQILFVGYDVSKYKKEINLFEDGEINKKLWEEKDLFSYWDSKRKSDFKLIKDIYSGKYLYYGKIIQVSIYDDGEQLISIKLSEMKKIFDENKNEVELKFKEKFGELIKDNIEIDVYLLDYYS